MNITFEELKKRFEAVDPETATLNTRCLCGKHVKWEMPSDEDIQSMVDIINGESQTKEIKTSSTLHTV